MPPTLDAVQGSRDLIPIRVVDVIDGDTIRVAHDTPGGSETRTVRLSNVDTPETNHFQGGLLTSTGETLGPGAKAATERFLEVKSPGGLQMFWPGRMTDSYGRAVGYIFNGDKQLNYELIKEGYSPYVANPRYGGAGPWESDMLAAQKDAMRATKDGGAETIWSPDRFKTYLERHGQGAFGNSQWSAEALESLPDGSAQLLKLPKNRKDKVFNPKRLAAGEAAKYDAGQIKIGTIWLPLPPEAISIQTDNEIVTHRLLRSSGSLAERTGYSQTLVSIHGKLDCDQLAGYLQPVLAQFAICPFLPIRNVDVERQFFDKGLLYATSSTESAAAHEKIAAAQKEIDAIYREIHEAVDTTRSEMSPERFADFVSGYAGELLRLTKTRQGFSLDDAVSESEENFNAKTDRWDGVLEHGVLLKGDAEHVNPVMEPEGEGYRGMIDSAAIDSDKSRTQRFKQWSYRLAYAKKGLEDAARDYTQPVDDIRMTEVWVALASFGASPLASSPTAFAFNMVLQVFNYLPYTTNIGFRGVEGGVSLQVDSPEESVPFNATWPQLLLENDLDQDSRAMTTFVQPPAGASGRTWGTSASRLLLVEHDPNASAAGIPFSPAGVLLGKGLDSVVYTYSGDFVTMPIEGEKYPTLQWMGSGTQQARLSFLTDDTVLLENLKDFDNSAALMARRYEKRGRSFYFTIKDPFLNAFGLSSCDIAQMAVESTENPGVWRVSITLQGIIPKMGEMYKTERVGDPNHPQPYVEAVQWCLNHPDKGELAGKVAQMLTDPPSVSFFKGGHLFSQRDNWFYKGGNPSEVALHEEQIRNNPDYLKKNPLCSEGRSILARVERRKPSDYENLPAAEGFSRLMTLWNTAQQEQITRARRLAGQDYNSGNKASGDSSMAGLSSEELTDTIISINKLLGPVADQIAQAAHNRSVDLPEQLKEIFAAANQMLGNIGEAMNKSLYPDFPSIALGTLQKYGMAGQTAYWNPDQWKVEPESPGYMVDPWFFLYVTPRTGQDGGPSEIPQAIEAAARFMAQSPSDRLSSAWLKANELWTSMHRKQATKGYFAEDIAKLSYGNSQDKQAIAKTAEELNYYEMAGVMDFMNVTTVMANEQGFVTQQTQRAIDASKNRWKGIAGALPTFWMAFIEKDANEWGLFDDFYGYQALESIYIVRSKREAMDVAYVTVSNLFGTLGGPLADRSGMGGETHGFAEGTDKENPSLENGAYPLQPGTQVIIKVGYGNNINKLETVFTGQVADIAEGPSMQLVLQGYGSELLDPIPPSSNSHDKFITHATAREVVELMLRMPKVNHFGRSPEVGFWESFFMSDPLMGLAPGDALHHKKVGKYFDMSSNRKETDIDDVNIWLPDIEPAGVVACQTTARFYPIFLTSGATPWQVIQDVVMDHPGTTAAVRPYDGRATLFVGHPEQDYFQSGRSLYTYNLKYKMAVGEVAQNTPTDVPPAEKRPFRKYHLCRSGVNLIRNNLEATKEFYNQVILDWAKLDGKWNWLTPLDQWDSFEYHANSGMIEATPRNGIHGGIDESAAGRHDGGELEAPCILTLDPGIPRDEVKALRVFKRNVCNEDQALRYAMSVLGECIERSYKGTIWMRSDEDIWPGDVIMLFDHATQMFGPIEVDEVVLHFDREVGYCYEIKPNAVVTMQNYATPEMLHSTALYMDNDGRIGYENSGKDLGKGAKRGWGGSLKADPQISSPPTENEKLVAAMSANPGFYVPPGWKPPKDTVTGVSSGKETLAELAQGEDRSMTEHAYVMLHNHPMSVFPLFYQGRTWWPLNHRGGQLDTFMVGRSTPGDSAASDAERVSFTNSILRMSRIVNVVKGSYSNRMDDWKEQK